MEIVNPPPNKKSRNLGFKFRLLRKNWRQPTLAEPIELLPSARLCLTAEFGMGSGRTTALWPPKSVTGDEWRVTGNSPAANRARKCKRTSEPRQLVTCHTPLATLAVL